MIRLAVFDIAGTTIDDRSLVYDALRDAVESFGVSVQPDDLQANMGTEKHDALRTLLVAGGYDPSGDDIGVAYDRFVTALKRYYDEQPPIAMPGVEEALTSARRAGVKVALTTGFTQDVAGLVLDGVGWRVGSLADGGMVDALVTADEVAAGRPAPYMIHRAMERTGIDDVVEVMTAGDTIADLLSGTRSGAAMVVGVLSGSGEESALRAQPHTHILPSVVEALTIAQSEPSKA